MKNLFLFLVALLFISTSYAQADSTKADKHKFVYEKLPEKRLVATDEIGVLIGFTGKSAGKYFFSYQTVTPWQFNRNTYIGIGMGFEISGKQGVIVQEGNSPLSIMVPFFGEIRHSFLKKRVSPYISEKLGYSLYFAHTKPEIVGGAMMETQLGMKAFITQKSAFNLSVGYRLQCLAVPQSYATQFSDAVPTIYGQPTVRKTMEYFSFLSIHAGFTY